MLPESLCYSNLPSLVHSIIENHPSHEIHSPRLVPSMHVGEHASRIDFRRDRPRLDLRIVGPATVAVASVARPEDLFRVAEEHDKLGVFRQFLVPGPRSWRILL